jgi:hypothetical protein
MRQTNPKTSPPKLAAQRVCCVVVGLLCCAGFGVVVCGLFLWFVFTGVSYCPDKARGNPPQPVPSSWEVVAMLVASISCGHCRGRHQSVSEVRECGRPKPVQNALPYSLPCWCDPPAGWCESQSFGNERCPSEPVQSVCADCGHVGECHVDCSSHWV